MPSDKLDALRERMREKGYDAYLVADADAHQNEYVGPYWRARTWLSGFTGSNGLVAVTAGQAGLWTDGRYFIQAERQLVGSGIALFKMDAEGVPTYPKWLAEQLPDRAKLGFDGRAFSVSSLEKLKEALAEKEIGLDGTNDLINEVWTDRPSPDTHAKVFAHDISFSGQSASEKLAAVRKAMADQKADWYLAAALDGVAWLLNIRGHDIPQTPVAYAFGLIGMDSAHIFIDPKKVDAPLAAALAAEGFTLHAYDAVEALTGTRDGLLLYDPARVNTRLAQSIPERCKVKKGTEDIIDGLKAVKNPVELENIRRAFIKDGVVMVRLLRWLDNRDGDTKRTEAHVADFLLRERALQALYLEPSFDTVAAYGENAACVHYSHENEGAEIKPQGFLLVDTGAQYLDGTTDVSRTIALGPLSDEMKRDFTLVLKGHIALAAVQFPAGTTGHQLDALARAPLWAAGLHYRHGTGHGLGYCLGVHEGPHNVSSRPNGVKLTAGMLLSNEPGVYKEGRYGIRTENILLVEERYQSEESNFLGFETLTLCPIDLRAVDKNWLTETETEWLNAYHRWVYATLLPYLTKKRRFG
jgi:Xaa-Pro aminopeptidase